MLIYVEYLQASAPNFSISLLECAENKALIRTFANFHLQNYESAVNAATDGGLWLEARNFVSQSVSVYIAHACLGYAALEILSSLDLSLAQSVVERQMLLQSLCGRLRRCRIGKLRALCSHEAF